MQKKRRKFKQNIRRFGTRSTGDDVIFRGKRKGIEKIGENPGKTEEDSKEIGKEIAEIRKHPGVKEEDSEG